MATSYGLAIVSVFFTEESLVASVKEHSLSGECLAVSTAREPLQVVAFFSQSALPTFVRELRS
ncbi:MAG: hypothetical protein K2X93_13090 [Candidatus Obscuribacterales bacterium]|nr:hypothetical protein [Candidatus Obscuribacterales bacterium]